MNKLLHKIIMQSDKQENLLAICKVLMNGEKSTVQIKNALQNQYNIYLDSNSNVLYKYLKKLLEAEIINVSRVESRVKYYSINTDYELDYLAGVETHDQHYLISMQKTLSRYSNFPINDFIEALIKNSEVDHSNQDYLIVDFDIPYEYGGNNFLDIFYWKIADCETVKFNYQRFEDERPIEVELKPYLIKEYNKRWYLVGQKKSSDIYLTYPLDRIVSIVENFEGATFKRDASFNPSTMWEHSIGIFRGEPSSVSFEVKDSKMKNIDFLRTAKIHSSQQEIKIDDQWMKIELEVFPSYELVREIRKLGVHNLRNISPDHLNDMVRND